MSLRIRKASTAKGVSSDQDGWLSRLTKLIPAEALALYGVGEPLTNGQITAIRVLAIFCLILSGVVRFVATRGDGKGPQWPAIGIAMFSFILWLLTLAPPTGPINLGKDAVYASLASLFWVTVVPLFYKGD